MFYNLLLIYIYILLILTRAGVECIIILNGLFPSKRNMINSIDHKLTLPRINKPRINKPPPLIKSGLINLGFILPPLISPISD